MDITIWIVLWFMVAASRLGFAGEGGAPDKLPATGQMPILAWCGVHPAYTSVERFRELAEAGFNQNFTTYASADELAKALDAAAQAGIKLHASYTDMLKDPAAAAKRFKDHPALVAWHIRDEPSAKDFPHLAKSIAQLESVDRNPAHFCYVNLFPNYASTGPTGQLGTATYEEHVRRFLAEVPVKVVSFDYYPITGNSLRPLWYENLDVIAKAAREAGKPFWAFALSVSHFSYPVPTLAHLRLEVYSDLAYGAQGIQYFTYWLPGEPGWGPAPIAADGKRTAVYDRVKKMNEEIRGLSGVFLGSTVVSVGHTGKPPQGTAPFAASDPIAGVKTEGEGAVVSRLARGHYRFLVIVNRDFNKPMGLEVARQGSTAMAVVGKDGTLTPLTGEVHRRTVEPGDAEILSWMER